MNNILCPNCGMPNPDDQNVCSFCRQPLRMHEESESIKPGDMPTKKTTADLEPVLPQWLRDAREKARQAAEESASTDAEAAHHDSTASAAQKPSPSTHDWLAGLEASAREEEQEELPDWMRGASTPSAPAKQEKQEKAEETFPRRQEIRWEDEPSSEATPSANEQDANNNLLSWMRGIEEPPAQAKKEESTLWQTTPAAPHPEEPSSPFASGTFRPQTGELSNWLSNLTAESAPAAPEAGTPAQSESLPDWLANLPRESIQPESGADDSAQPMADSSDWLQREPGQAPAPSQKSEAPTESFGADLELPDWMKSRPDETSAPQPESAPTSNWMKPQSELPADSQAASDDLPSWLSSQTAQAGEPVNAPAFLPGQEPISQDEVDNLFSIEMPDWLSKIETTGEQKSTAPVSQENISPADLPSWVQAMRPVETVLPGAESNAAVTNQPMEEQGPLAGLQGVLPALAGWTTGKPKTISIRLEPSQEQQENAALLEKLLAFETEAKPIHSGSTALLSQRALRWVVTVILLTLIIFGLFNGSALVPLPTILPDESEPIPGILDALPGNAPVLLIADYEPALAGEMEAAATPLLDVTIGLRSPRFTILSTSPTGAALAERLLTSDTLSRHAYQNGINYSNLGYLPGGNAGILAFAQSPNTVMPLDASGAPAWNSVAARGIHSLSDYALILLLTDRGESARSWVEQTEGRRGATPVIVVSSAQSAPMVMPYVLSGQVQGLVSGMRGGAAFTQEMDFSSPVRQYWNAFHLAALAVVIIIAVGALWNWIAGLRARARGLGEI